MSVWTQVEGVVRVPKKCRVGLSGLIKTHFDEFLSRAKPFVEEQEYLETEHSRYFKFAFAFCDDGIPAAKRVQKFCDEGRELGYFQMNMEANIRFF